MNVPSHGTKTTQATQSAFEAPRMSRRRKMSASAKIQSVISGIQISSRKKTSQNVEPTSTVPPFE